MLHDNTLLDAVTNADWILRDQTLHSFALPCSAARQALQEQDESIALCHKAKQEEIGWVSVGAQQLATWGRVYDNEDLVRKVKQTEKQVTHPKDEQTELSVGPPWCLSLRGDALSADRLLKVNAPPVAPAPGLPSLFATGAMCLRNDDRVATMGRNGGSKSLLLRLLWQQVNDVSLFPGPRLYPWLHPDYYDQALEQLSDDTGLFDTLAPFAPSADTCRWVLITAGFGWARHSQKVSTLSDGERSRLLFAGLPLACYGLLLLDESTNHLSMGGKAAPAQALCDYLGGVLLVSHDRQLINENYNRSWLVDNVGLAEWYSLEGVYAHLQAMAPAPDSRLALQSTPAGADDDEEALLARLIDLEQWLADDMAHKPRHQGPSL